VVENEPGQQSGRPVNGGGHGLLGMKERVRVYGGDLDAHPGAAGGFIVRASIPLGDPAS